MTNLLTTQTKLNASAQIIQKNVATVSVSDSDKEDVSNWFLLNTLAMLLKSLVTPICLENSSKDGENENTTQKRVPTTTQNKQNRKQNKQSEFLKSSSFFDVFLKLLKHE